MEGKERRLATDVKTMIDCVNPRQDYQRKPKEASFFLEAPLSANMLQGEKKPVLKSN
jgi:hypothetical protein